MKYPEKQKAIRLKSGRKIHLDEILQWRTYECLLLGIPDKQINEKIVADSIKKAREKISLSIPIHLIEPAREKLFFSRNKSVRLHREYEQIPAIACAATFESAEPARDKECFSSRLICIWFQKDWALPIAPRIVAQIRNTDWNDLAEDCMP